eukprot:GHUV01034874.1.p1 GENE.GHUV01034874.1~~GHUV01034874.1.p1  ORF type:complete len:217 (+),score=82.71 GHUV01034874.1:98-748(+)
MCLHAMADSQRLSSLVQASDGVLKHPAPIHDNVARRFLEQQPLQQVFGLLSSHECDVHQLDTICAALTKVLETQYGTSLLPNAADYAEAALQSPQQRLRRLGCQQIGRLLVITHDQQLQQHLQQLLVNALQDSDTGVAGEAERALIAHAAEHPPAFQGLITGSSPAGADLLQLADEGSSTQHMRVFALLTAAAADNSSNVEQLKHSGGHSGSSCRA